MDQPDESLLSLLATDLDRHFRQLVIHYQQRLYTFALRLAKTPQDAEDIVQETFIRAYHALKGYPAYKIQAIKLRQWLYKITLNIFRNRHRKSELLAISLDCSEESSLLEIEDTSPWPDEVAFWNEWRSELEALIAILPEYYRIAITLYYFEDLSHAEIAELLNQPVGTVKSSVHRGVGLLRKALEAQTQQRYTNEVR